MLPDCSGCQIVLRSDHSLTTCVSYRLAPQLSRGLFCFAYEFIEGINFPPRGKGGKKKTNESPSSTLTHHQAQTHFEAECMSLGLCFRAVVTEMLEQVKHTLSLVRAALPNESPIELTTH